MSFESSGQLWVRDRIKTTCRSERYEPNPRVYLVYHHTASAGDSENYIATTDRMSIHYLIKRNGSVVRFGWETFACWHAGRTLFGPPRGPGVALDQTGNADMLGIEIEHSIIERHPYDPFYGEVSRYYPAAQLRALDMLAADIYERSPQIVRTVSHAEIAYPRGRKTDPEYMKDHMDDQQIGRVRERLGLSSGGGNVVFYKNPNVNDLPNTYPPGVTRLALSGKASEGNVGWPIGDGVAGMVVTDRYDEAGNRVRQTNYATGSPDTFYRDGGGKGESWGPWFVVSGRPV